MGEIREPGAETPRETADALADAAELRGDTDLAASLRTAGDIPQNVNASPLILDTDIGGDPDDAVAVALAALHIPELALVVTSDECDGQRARLARHLLDLCGRPGVPVTAGPSTTTTKYRAFDGLIPRDIANQSDGIDALMVEVDRILLIQAKWGGDGQRGIARWLGIGPMTNLAALMSARPELADRLDVTQMGGAINYRRPDRAEHNVRLDIDAARTVLHHKAVRWVMSDVTFKADIEITTDHPLYQRLTEPDAPGWAQLIANHMRQWFAKFVPGTMQHDALTLTAAMGLPFVDFGLEHIAMDDLGRMTHHPDGHEAWISYRADYPAFNTWLDKHLTH